jgi:hypothetical protein
MTSALRFAEIAVWLFAFFVLLVPKQVLLYFPLNVLNAEAKSSNEQASAAPSP